MADSSIFIVGGGSGGGNAQDRKLKRANRHGMIACATATGKTVTLQGIVKSFFLAGIPSRDC